MFRLAVLVVVVSLLGGCATEEGYKKALDTWVGSTEDELVSAWGPPSNVYNSPSKIKFLTYHDSQTVFVPGVAPSYNTTFIGQTAYTNRIGGTPSRTLNYSCSTTFEIRHDRIRSWSFKGNSCKATSD